jgi:hypothetical protein
MFLRFADRPSDSPYIERVWRGRSDGGGPFVSVAAGHLELVVTRLADFAMVTISRTGNPGDDHRLPA